MKKPAAILTAAVIAAAMSAAAYAESPINGADLETDIPDIPVTADYNKKTTVKPAYNVEISWGELAFTYHDAVAGVWQPDTHVYEGSKESEWTVDSEGGDEITVTNRSNKAVNASFGFTAAEGYDVGADFSKDSVTLETAENADPLPTETVTVIPTGSITEGDGVTIGTVTVTITEKTE